MFHVKHSIGCEAYLDLLRRWQEHNQPGWRGNARPIRGDDTSSTAGSSGATGQPGATILADLGSGAGLPGLVLAVLGAPVVHLVESDRRKAAFLREAARACGAAVAVHAQRIEAVPPLAADVITARALAPVAAPAGVGRTPCACGHHIPVAQGPRGRERIDPGG